MEFCCAEQFAHAVLMALLSLLQAPITQLEYSQVLLDRMLQILDKRLFDCCVLTFAAEHWANVWEHLSSTSLCLGMSELRSQKQASTELALR